MTSDVESRIIEILELLRREYEKACKPYVDQLCRIRSLKQSPIFIEKDSEGKMTKHLHLDYDGGERKAYRLPVNQLILAIQTAHLNGFSLRCVATGSLWVLVELTETERQMLCNHVTLEENK